MYIPACPLTEANAKYLKRQRETFIEGKQTLVFLLSPAHADLVLLGTPAPDFPSGVGESEHLGRLAPDFIMQNIEIEAQRSMGLTRFDSERRGLPQVERQMLENANEILGFA